MPLYAYPMSLLGALKGADFNSTADQGIPIALGQNGQTYAVTGAWARSVSGLFTLAAGGIYPAAAKAGTPIVPAAQVYSGLTAPGLAIPLTLNAAIVLSAGTLFLSLTTAQGTAATGDIWLVGFPVP